MSFRLIAIRPLSGCNEKILKNLRVNQLYKFYNDYEFYIGEEKLIDSLPGEISEIIFDSTVPEDLYFLGDENYKSKINVSAIVGKNGSGKSALIELLVAAIVKMSIEIDKSFINENNLYNHTNPDRLKELISFYLDSLKNDLNGINVEFFYYYNQFNDYNKRKIRKITIFNNEITVIDFRGKTGESSSFLPSNEIKIMPRKKSGNNFYLSQKEINFFKDFFYTMIINYSHYGFNTQESGEWLKGVFHKNDGYQLPIVINPFREKGNIDINNEKDLAASRFLVNILQEKKLRNISDHKTVTHLSVAIDFEKFRWDYEKKRDKRIFKSEKNKEIILDEIFNKFEIKENRNKKHELYPFIRDYLLRKLIRMTHYSVYKEFENCFKYNRDTYFISDKDKVSKYIEALSNDFSHNTDKFRQALFFLRFLYLDADSVLGKKKRLVKIDELDTAIKNSWDLSRKDLPIISTFHNDKYTVRESLPSIFKINYFFGERVSANNFNNLSSGEKQKLFSIHSVIYHLRNLKSVQEFHNDDDVTNRQLIYYKNVNIIFDEIELYAHPDYQKKFLNDFLQALNSIYQRFDNINVVFITHSPFILSDIPKQNVLFLVEGKPQNFDRMNTFAANITDLLSNSFFIQDGLIGDFAKKTINSTISWINYEKKIKEKKKSYKPDSKDYLHHEKVIQLIDEPILKMKLAEMIDELQDKDTLQREIAMREVEYLKNKYKL